MRRAAKDRGGGARNSVSRISVVQLDFSDGMHMTENSYIPQSARMRAQIQANTANFARQRFRSAEQHPESTGSERPGPEVLK